MLRNLCTKSSLVPDKSEGKIMEITVFRVYDSQWIYDEIEEGRLRQGWGAPGFNLCDVNNKLIPKDKWEKTYKDVWEEAPSKLRYTILSRMPTNLTGGHVVVIPKMRGYNKFAIAKVRDGYKFDASDDLEDFRHVIDIHPESVRTFHNHANEHAFHISGLFKSNRSAVNCPISDDRSVSAAKSLLEIEMDGNLDSNFGAADALEFYIQDSYKSVAETLKNKVTDWDGNRFENAIRKAFKDQGYTLQTGYSRFDGEGADCDLLVNLPESKYDLFLAESKEIAVQVKHKYGVAYDDVWAIIQIVKWAELNGNDNTKKCVMSSADSFTEEAQELAESHDVVLICGLQTMCFLLGKPDVYREDWG